MFSSDVLTLAAFMATLAVYAWHKYGSRMLVGLDLDEEKCQESKRKRLIALIASTTIKAGFTRS